MATTYNYTISTSDHEKFQLSEADAPWTEGSGEYESLQAAMQAAHSAIGRELDWDPGVDGETQYWTASASK